MDEIENRIRQFTICKTEIMSHTDAMRLHVVILAIVITTDIIVHKIGNSFLHAKTRAFVVGYFFCLLLDARFSIVGFSPAPAFL